MKAYDIKKGNVVEHGGGVYQVRDIERSSPQGRGGNVRFRFVMYSSTTRTTPRTRSTPTPSAMRPATSSTT